MKIRIGSLLAFLLCLALAAPALPGSAANGAGDVFLPLVLRDWPQPAEVRILDNHFAYVTSTDDLHIVGEVLNELNINVKYIKVTATVKDQNGATLATEDRYVHMTVLAAGEKGCFDIRLDVPAGWAGYTFEPVSYLEGGTPLTGLTLLNPVTSVDPTFKWYVVTGQVRNDRTDTVELVAPVVTLYNSSGIVVGCGNDYVDGFDLNPGQTSAFEINVMGRDFSDVTNHRLQVDGTPE